MPAPNFVILYVDSPEKSAVFYEDLLGQKPVEASPTFALFILESGIKLGLWSKHIVEPASPTAAGGSCELVFTMDDNDAVEAMHTDWQRRGLPILQGLTEMDFGYTFVALDPDRHRLRVYALAD